MNENIKYTAIPISELDVSLLKVGEYFVIKQFAGTVKTTEWFNGKNFDSNKITHVLVENL